MTVSNINQLPSSKIGRNYARSLDIKKLEYQDKTVVRMIIIPSKKPVYYRQDKNSQPEFYIRLGSTDRKLNVKDAIEYALDRFNNITS